MGTLFNSVYKCFLGKITDDLYIELTPQDTLNDLQNLLISAIPGFEFPRKILTDYVIEVKVVNKEDVPSDALVISSNENEATIDNSYFLEDLTSEEVNILAILMLEGWVQRQTSSIENTRMKYSGSDFKMTSQANHLQKLLALLSETQRQSLHMQRLYKRRRHDKDGKYESNWSVLREVSALD